MTLMSKIKVIVRVTVHNFAYISTILGPVVTNCDHNDGIAAGNKNVISSDIENVGQGHHLQKSQYLSYHATGFNNTVTKMMKQFPAARE